MILGQYDTDDLTDRQRHYFDKLCNEYDETGRIIGHKITATALTFLSYSVRQNFCIQKFKNYDTDCQYLFQLSKEVLVRHRISLDEIYK